MAAGDLAKRLGLSSSRLTRIIDGLVAKRIVKESTGGKDRRIVEIQLTPEGVHTRDQLILVYVTVHQDIISLLPSDAVNLWSSRCKTSFRHPWMDKGLIDSF